MLMQAEPVYLAYKDIEERIQKRIQNAKMQNAETEEQDAEVKVQNAGIQDAETVSPDKKLRVVYLSPQGKTFDQKMAEELAEEEDLVLLCGHYEGIDERVLEEISEFTEIEIVPAEEHTLEITHKDSNKSEGLMVLSDIYEIDPENIMAIGDSYNDAMMLAWAGTGVAMGNADERLKAVADYVTDVNTQAGMAKAVYQIALGNNMRP